MEQVKFTKVTMMKLKLKPVLAGAIALTLAAPLAVKAQSNQPNQPVRGQSQNQPQIAGVKITQQQQQQLHKRIWQICSKALLRKRKEQKKDPDGRPKPAAGKEGLVGFVWFCRER